MKKRIVDFRSLFLWTAPIGVAALLLAVEGSSRRGASKTIPAKGRVSRFSVRADVVAAFDLHESRVEEMREAKEQYVPIYRKDNKVLFDARNRLLQAIRERPIAEWSWRAAYLSAPDAEDNMRAQDSATSDAGVNAPAEVEQALADHQREELIQVVKACFRLLEPYYQHGVVADSEFPSHVPRVRLFSRGRYVVRKPEKLHHFSDLQPAITERGAHFLFKTDPRLRSEIIDYILKRLPANVTYAEENARFVADISHVTGVKVLPIRRGAILAERGKFVDTRAFHALNAESIARRSTSPKARTLGRLFITVSILYLWFILFRVYHAAEAARLAPHLLVYGGLLFLVVVGRYLLMYWPVDGVIIPHAALVLVFSVLFGRRPGLLVGLTLPAALATLFHFDLQLMIIWTAGGTVAALVSDLRARRWVVPAGIFVGLAQSVVCEAYRAAAGIVHSSDMSWWAAQAFAGGAGGGVLALMMLPFAQRVTGQTSEGKVIGLANWDRPMLRVVREETPEFMSRVVRIASAAEAAARAVKADHRLVRTGALFVSSACARACARLERRAQQTNNSSRLEPEVLKIGHEIAGAYHLRADLLRFIEERPPCTWIEHGTAADNGRAQHPTISRRPQSLETAIVWIALLVQAAGPLAPVETKERVLALQPEGLFTECGMTQSQLHAIATAMIFTQREQNGKRSADG